MKRSTFYFKDGNLRINDQILQVGDVNVRCMDATRVSGVMRKPILRMQYVTFVVARSFQECDDDDNDENDENYLLLDYTPYLILTSVFKQKSAMGHINHLPLHSLSERIQYEAKHVNEQEFLNTTSVATVEKVNRKIFKRHDTIC